MEKQKHFYLIRGLVRESRHWDDFPEQILLSFPDSKITMIDIPGAGEYYDSPSPLSVKTMTEKMRQKFLSLRAETEEAILVAISLGGMIACDWLNRYSADFSKAFLINTSFGNFSPVYHRLRPQALLHLLKVPFLTGRTQEAHILKLVSHNEARYDQTLELWDRICQERPVSSVNAIRQLLAAVSFSVGKFSPSIPMFLLGSTNDKMVSIKCSRAIAKKWNVPLIEHPEGGHDLTSDHPDWVAGQLKSLIVSS